MGNKETGAHSVTSEVSSKCPVGTGPGTKSGGEHSGVLGGGRLRTEARIEERLQVTLKSPVCSTEQHPRNR